MIEIGDLANDRLSDDDLDYIQEMLAGLVEPTVEIAARHAKRNKNTQPLQSAMIALLGERGAKKTSLTV